MINFLSHSRFTVVHCFSYFCQMRFRSNLIILSSSRRLPSPRLATAKRPISGFLAISQRNKWRNTQSMSVKICFNFIPSKNTESLLFIVTSESAVHKNTFQTIAMKQRTVVTGQRHSNRMRKDDGRCDQFPCLNMHSDCVDIYALLVFIFRYSFHEETLSKCI